MTDLEYLKKYYNGNIEDAIKRLNNNEPVQYIVGNVDFYGNIINVDKRVLIPRFETEELVDYTKKYINEIFKDKIDVVDLGTGSGCIAITLSKLVDCNMDAVDISNDALDVAKLNAKNNNVDINFYLGDMLNPLNKKYDVIISNPPYIAYDEEVMDIVKNNEPNNALYADNDGLKYYEDILSKARLYLKDKFIIAFEIGYNQGSRLKDLANKYFSDSKFILKQDMQHFDRFVFIIRD